MCCGCTWSMYRCRLCLRFLPLVTTASLPSAAADTSTWASLNPFVCFSTRLEAAPTELAPTEFQLILNTGHPSCSSLGSAAVDTP